MKPENRGRPRDYDREKEGIAAPGFGVKPGNEVKLLELMSGRKFESYVMSSARGAMPARPPSLERGSAS